MAEPTEHPRASKMMVVFLRLYAEMNQTELARAVGLSSQSRISEMESGDDVPSEEMLRRIATAVEVRWELVTHLRRFINAFLFAAERGGVVPPASAEYPESLAVLAYLLEDAAADQWEPPSEARLAAERFWQGVAGLPSPRRRRTIELSPRASKSWALAELLCHESERAAAAESLQEALELAELALSVAGRVEGKEEWKRQLQGYVWAFVGNARRVAKDHPGAGAAFAKARELWRSGVASEDGLLKEERMPR